MHVFILQDSRELCATKQRLSSVPIVQNVMTTDCTIYRLQKKGKMKLPDEILTAMMDHSAVLLFPSDKSTPLDASMANRIKLLVVIDGSWKTVLEILRYGDSRLRNKIPHVHIPSSNNTANVSLYQSMGIRREPNNGFLSTLEAIAYAIHTIVDSSLLYHELISKFEAFLLKLSMKGSKIVCDSSSPVIEYNPTLVSKKMLMKNKKS
jgi:DTW domain-containing protein YfiP